MADINSYDYFNKYVNSPRYKQMFMSYPWQYFDLHNNPEELKKLKDNAKSIYQQQQRDAASDKRIADMNNKTNNFLNWNTLNNWSLVWAWSVAWMPSINPYEFAYDLNRINEQSKSEQKNEQQDNWWATNWSSTNKWWWWKRRTNQVWNANAVKQPEPTYVDPNGVTHTWMTQEEFDASMRMYEADNQWRYEHRRNQVVWANWATRWQIFDQVLDKFLANPDAFSEDQKQLLIKAWKELWYFNWSSTTQSQPTAQTAVDTATQNTAASVTATPSTVQQNATIAPTQRRVDNANDAYYSVQWRPYFWVTL